MDTTVTQYLQDPNTEVVAWIWRVSSPNAPDVIHLEIFQSIPGMELRWETRQGTFLAGSAVPETNNMRHEGLHRLLQGALEEANLWEDGASKKRTISVTLSCRRSDDVFWSDDLGVIRVRLIGSDLEPVQIQQQPGLEEHHGGLFPILKAAIAARIGWRLEKRPPPGRRFELTRLLATTGTRCR